jgi:hypothetical protein
MTLTEFLLARIAEDEALALAAIEDDDGEDGGLEDEFGRLTRRAGTPTDFSPSFGDACARMIVWNTPRRVLAECEAKRQIVRLHTGSVQDCVGHDDPANPACPTLRALALPYADHEDHQPEWKFDNPASDFIGADLGDDDPDDDERLRKARKQAAAKRREARP